MGKTLENDPPKTSHFLDKSEEELFEIQLPLPLTSKEEVLEGLRGYYLAIYDGEIIAMDKSLRKLYKTLENLIPKGKRCEIEYIEEGASIYGFSL